MAAGIVRQVAAATMLLWLLTLLTAPVVAAAQMAAMAPTATGQSAPDPSTGPPMALAHTGLDMTGPLLAGFAVLLLGVALVAWAVLRVGRGSRQH